MPLVLPDYYTIKQENNDLFVSEEDECNKLESPSPEMKKREFSKYAN